jgi:hypothetical protein
MVSHPTEFPATRPAIAAPSGADIQPAPPAPSPPAPSGLGGGVRVDKHSGPPRGGGNSVEAVFTGLMTYHATFCS